MKIKWLAFRILVVTGLLTVAVFAAVSQQKQNVEPKKPAFKAVSLV